MGCLWAASLSVEVAAVQVLHTDELRLGTLFSLDLIALSMVDRSTQLIAKVAIIGAARFPVAYHSPPISSTSTKEIVPAALQRFPCVSRYTYNDQ